MFQNPTRAKRLYFDVIPKMTDEYLKLKKDFEAQKSVKNTKVLFGF